jgi:hydroxymethylglutaryl-CoA synthase
MAEYAGAFLLRHEWRGGLKWKKIVGEIGPEPKREDFETEDEFRKSDKLFRKKFAKSDVFQETFKEKIEKSLVGPRRIGNIYNGSLYLGFHSTLEVEHKDGKDLAGKRFAFGSYGSGYTFKAFGGVIQPDYKEVVKRLDLLTKLDQRREISLKEYEDLHEGVKKKSIMPPKNEFALVRIGKEGMEEGYRFYEFIK